MRLGEVDLVAADDGVERPERLQRDLHQPPLGRRHQRGRDAGLAYGGHQGLRPGTPRQPLGEQRLGQLDQAFGAGGEVQVGQAEVLAEDPHRGHHVGADHGHPGRLGERAALLGRQLLERDRPQLLGFDERSVHVEEHRGDRHPPMMPGRPGATPGRYRRSVGNVTGRD
jgi:hypothetical protein